MDYLQERQPALDYSTLNAISSILGKLFWADLEQHHPGITSLHLPDDVARAWKQRLQACPGSPDASAPAERISYGQCLAVVRAFYLDLTDWAGEDPARWAQHAMPCPIRAHETRSRKAQSFTPPGTIRTQPFAGKNPDQQGRNGG